MNIKITVSESAEENGNKKLTQEVAKITSVGFAPEKNR